MNARRLAGAIAGGLVGGIGLTAMMMLGEKKSGAPSELTQLERSSAGALGLRTPPDGRLPDAGEQAVVQGGHLLLSAAAAAVYAAATDEEAGVVASGVAFGLGFYAVAHWIAGPLLGVKQAEWKADRATIGMHAANHVAFGLLTAAGAKAAAR